jgi:hypothetical protein
MALEAVVFPGGFYGYGGGMELEGSNAANACWAASLMIPATEVPDGSSSSAALPPPVQGGKGAEGMAAAGRRKRRRATSVKDVEEAESQRMTHIAVERNRRRQMNEYLAALRSIMPTSYVQRVCSRYRPDS